jgi:hypothetical protein
MSNVKILKCWLARVVGGTSELNLNLLIKKFDWGMVNFHNWNCNSTNYE